MEDNIRGKWNIHGSVRNFTEIRKDGRSIAFERWGEERRSIHGRQVGEMSLRWLSKYLMKLASSWLLLPRGMKRADAQSSSPR